MYFNYKRNSREGGKDGKETVSSGWISCIHYVFKHSIIGSKFFGISPLRLGVKQSHDSRLTIHDF